MLLSEASAKTPLMQPVPSELEKSYARRGPLQQFRFRQSTAFRCFRCGQTKKSKLLAIYYGDWSKRMCNGCYGCLLSIYTAKAGTDEDEDRARALAEALLSLVALDDRRRAEWLFQASEKRAERLFASALRFIASAEHIAGQLEAFPQLEWSGAVIGLCKAFEVEIEHRILRPLADRLADSDLAADIADKRLSRIATFCADADRKPPELGAFAFFLQMAAHSRKRRQSSILIGGFLELFGDFVGSDWLLDPDGLHQSLILLISNFRNRAAHVDELDQDDYSRCRDLIVGTNGAIWKLILSTEAHKRT